MNFFLNQKQRDLWVRLNAEHIRFHNKVMNSSNKEDLGSIDEKYSYMWISNNQLIYDETNLNAPRLSLEELSSLSHEELLILSKKRTKKLINELFGEIDEEEIIEDLI